MFTLTMSNFFPLIHNILIHKWREPEAIMLILGAHKQVYKCYAHYISFAILSFHCIIIISLSLNLILLLWTGLDVETRLSFDWTLLMCAVNVAEYNIAKLLLDRGANASFSQGQSNMDHC